MCYVMNIADDVERRGKKISLNTVQIKKGSFLVVSIPMGKQVL